MCGNGTNRDTQLNKVCCHDIMSYLNQVSNRKVLTQGTLKSSTVSVTDTYPIKSIISSSSMPNNDVTKAGGSGDKDESFPQE